MRFLLPLSLTFTALFLCGCPDTKMPKAPPKIPEPKAALSSPPGPVDRMIEAVSGQAGIART